MRRLHLFRDHPHRSIHENEQESGDKKHEDQPKLDCRTNHSTTSFEYQVLLGEEVRYMMRVNKETGAVHVFMAERMFDFGKLDDLYTEWPDLPVVLDKDVNAAFRAMMMDDGLQLPDTPGCNDRQVNENDCQSNEYSEVPEQGVLKRQMAVCDPDCGEYFIKIGNSQYILRVNTDNWCRLNVRQEAREFKLEDIYDAVPELPLLLNGEVNGQLRDKLHADGWVVPDTPYELGYLVSKDKD
jgi:hypothetical protein